MRDVLQLHLKMQRRSQLEIWIAVGSMVALTFLFAASVCLHSYVEELDDSMHSTRNQRDAPLAHSFPQRKNKLKQKPTDIQLLHPSLMRYHPPPEDTLRQQFENENIHSLDPENIHRFLERQRVPHPKSPSHMPYDIFDCPITPPNPYPATWNAVHDVLRHWNPDSVDIPSDYIYQGLCIFDWRNPNHSALIDTYRRAELPFVLWHHPQVARTAHRWHQPGYLEQLVGRSTWHRNEYGHHTNHLMYWRRNSPGRAVPSDWQPPTQDVQLNITDWMNKADALEEELLLLDNNNNNNNSSHQQQAHADHWYFRLNAALPNTNTYLYDELPFFQPSDDPTLFMVDSQQQRGINCRFGMKGSIAEAHYDPTRNWIVVLQGRRRYILAHPRECPHLELYPLGHPSGRHSSVDWSRIVVDVDKDQAPKPNRPFYQLRVTEVVLQAGDALYLPTSWFHFIVSLNKNYQCNARSGTTYENAAYIQRCGFSAKA